MSGEGRSALAILAFQALLPAGFPAALAVFGLVALFAAALAVPLFRGERPRTPGAGPA